MAPSLQSPITLIFTNTETLWPTEVAFQNYIPRLGRHDSILSFMANSMLVSLLLPVVQKE